MRTLGQMALDMMIASADHNSHYPSLVDEFQEEYEQPGETVMSNIDHAIDDRVAAKLKTGKFWAPYTAEEFYAFVFWDPDEAVYRAHVKRYRAYQKTASGTLNQIMQELSDEYGWD